MLTITTWDAHAINDGTNYKSGFSPADVWGLPVARVASVARSGGWPVYGSLERDPVEFSIFIAIEDSSNIRALRAQLMRWFDPEDGTPKQLIITDDGAANPRYRECTCQSIRPVHSGDVGARDLFRAVLVVSGDVRWRSTSTTTDIWAITASGDTNVVANAGDDDVYPVYKIEPTTGKGTGFLYRCWVPIKWLSLNAGPQYPLMAIMDTATPVAAAKMQADGDDLRVLIDGIETNRWLNDMNDATTDIWFNVDFIRAPALVLKTTIAGAGAIASIEFTDAVELALMPDRGIVLIENEAFTYTERDLVGGAVTGVTREAKGTTIAGHAAGLTCYWIQHDIYIVYGNAALAAPTTDDAYKPIFELALSTNTNWYCANFAVNIPARADIGKVRSGSWIPTDGSSILNNCGVYSAAQKTWANIVSVAGAYRCGDGITCFSQGWTFENPCGIVNATWVGGEKRCEDITEFLVHLRYWVRGDSWWSEQGDVAAPAVPNNWEAWTDGPEMADWDPADAIGMYLYLYNSEVGVSLVDVDLYAAEVPVVTVNAEQGNYELSAVLSNNTTGEAIEINFVLDLNSELEIDTYDKVVTWLEDDTRQQQVVELDSARRTWLRLQPGNNTLEFTDVATGNVTLTTTWEDRDY